MNIFRVLRIAAVTAAILPLWPAAAVSDDGGPAAPPRTAPSPFIPLVLRESSTPDSAIVTLPVPPVIAEGPPPVLRHLKPEYPPAFQLDSVSFLKSRLSQWRQPDMVALLGPSQSQRPAYDEDGKPNGTIYTYADPLNRYKAFEFDFATNTGKLRTLFVYPLHMNWQECRGVYGADVSTAKAGKGRTFYSYLNRRLDVLVDAGGNVISLGIY